MDSKQIEEFLEIACCGAFDGSHHKDWVIQQMVKKVLGWDDAKLKQWIDSLAWEEGIAP